MDYNEDEKEQRKIIVRNIHDSRIDEELLYELFLQAGPINSLIMPIGHNGRPNLAIVEYAHESAVPYALFIFDGTELYGCRLNISSANRTPPKFYDGPNKSKAAGPPLIMNQSKAAGPPLIMNPPSIQPFENPFMMNILPQPNEPNFEQLLQMGQNLFMPGLLGQYNPYMNQMSPMDIMNSPRDYQRSNISDDYRNDRNYSRSRNNHRSHSPDRHRNNSRHHRK